MRRLFLALTLVACLSTRFAHADPAPCSPMDKAETKDPWDNAICCDGEVSDDGCGPRECNADDGDPFSERVCGKPVDVLTGFMWVHGTDVEVPAPAGPAVELRRTYSSTWAQSKGGRAPGVLGAGWAHGYSAHLELGGGGTPAAQVTCRRADTGTQVFTLVNGAYTSRHPSKALRFEAATQLYILEDRNSALEVFDVQGRLERVRDEDGGEVQLWYVGEDADCAPSATRPAGQLCRVDFVFGQRLWFWYTGTAAGVRLDRVSWDAAGAVLAASFGYDPEGYLTSATGADGVKVAYEYGFTHSFPRGAPGTVKLLTKVVDAEGYALETFTYRQYRVSQSRVEFHTTQDGFFRVATSPERREASLTGTSGSVSLTWKNGKVRTSCRSGPDGVVRLDRCQEFDIPDDLAAARCARNVDGYYTRTERDSLGRAIAVVKGLEACEAPSATDLARATTSGYLAGSNRLAFEQGPSVDPTAPAGFRATTVYDYTSPAAQTDPFCGQEACQKPDAYNKEGSLASQVQQVVRIGRSPSIDGTWATRVTAVRHQYGPLGQRTKTTGPRRDIDDGVSYDYYDAGSGGPEAGRLKAVRRGSTVIASYSDYAPCGKARRITDEAGNTTVFDYDLGGRLLFVQRPGDPGRTSYQYRANGKLWKVTFPSGRWLSYEPDALGRTGSIEWHDDTGALVEKVVYVHVSDSAKEPDGRIAAVEYYARTTRVRRVDYAYGVDGSRSDERADGAWTVQFYDEERRLAGTLDGNHHSQPSDWESRNVEHLYDATGELERVRRWIAGQRIDLSRFSRDVQGNIATVTDASGIQSRYVYDDFGNLVEYTSPSTGTRRYAYDEAGNLVKERTPDGTDITRTYDERGRLLSVSAVGIDERYAYGSDDASSVLDCATGLALGPSRGAGRLTKVEDASGVTYFGYTVRGERSFEALLAEGASCARTFRWSWNENGDLASLRYPTGHELVYEYAGTHLLSKIIAKAGSRTVVVAENIAFQGGRLAGYTAGNGMSWSLTRMADGWPDLWKVALPDARVVRRQRTGNHHDGAGNLTQVDSEPAARSITYRYETDLNVLSHVEGPSGVHDYTVLATGDRTSADGVEYCYEEGTSRLAAVGTTTRFEYSPSGATWKIADADGTRALCYDAKEQLVRVVGPGGEVVGQVNNWQHRRVATLAPINDLRTDFRFDGTMLLEERGYASLKAQYPRPTVEYVYLHGQPVAALHSKENADGTQSEVEVAYLFGGRTGEVMLEADEEARPTWWHELEGFGPAQALGRMPVEQSVNANNGGGAFGVPGGRAIRVHFKEFQMPCGFVALRMTDEGFERAATVGPERSGSFWSEWMRGGSITTGIVTTGCAAGQAQSAAIDRYEVEFGSVERRTLSLASASPYPAGGQQFEIDFGGGGYAFLDRNAPASCDRLEARDAAGTTLWHGRSDKARTWTTRLAGKVQLGIWGQGCNATEKAAGFSITKLVLDKAPPPPAPFAWPGQYADSTGLVENWFRFYDPWIGRYLQPESLLARGFGPKKGGGTAGDPSGRYLNGRGKVRIVRGVNLRRVEIVPGHALLRPLATYAYAQNNPIVFTDPNGLNPDPDAGCAMHLVEALCRCIQDGGRGAYVMNDSGELDGLVCYLPCKVSWYESHPTTLKKLEEALSFAGGGCEEMNPLDPVDESE